MKMAKRLMNESLNSLVTDLGTYVSSLIFLGAAYMLAAHLCGDARWPANKKDAEAQHTWSPCSYRTALTQMAFGESLHLPDHSWRSNSANIVTTME